MALKTRKLEENTKLKSSLSCLIESPVTFPSPPNKLPSASVVDIGIQNSVMTFNVANPIMPNRAYALAYNRG